MEPGTVRTHPYVARELNTATGIELVEHLHFESNRQFSRRATASAVTPNPLRLTPNLAFNTDPNRRAFGQAGVAVNWFVGPPRHRGAVDKPVWVSAQVNGGRQHPEAH